MVTFIRMAFLSLSLTSVQWIFAQDTKDEEASLSDLCLEALCADSPTYSDLLAKRVGKINLPQEKAQEISAQFHELQEAEHQANLAEIDLAEKFVADDFTKLKHPEKLALVFESLLSAWSVNSQIKIEEEDGKVYFRLWVSPEPWMKGSHTDLLAIVRETLNDRRVRELVAELQMSDMGELFCRAKYGDVNLCLEKEAASYKLLQAQLHKFPKDLREFLHRKKKYARGMNAVLSGKNFNDQDLGQYLLGIRTITLLLRLLDVVDPKLLNFADEVKFFLGHDLKYLRTKILADLEKDKNLNEELLKNLTEAYNILPSKEEHQAFLSEVSRIKETSLLHVDHAFPVLLARDIRSKVQQIKFYPPLERCSFLRDLTPSFSNS